MTAFLKQTKSKVQLITCNPKLASFTASKQYIIHEVRSIALPLLCFQSRENDRKMRLHWL